jgi:hypothetical protein
VARYPRGISSGVRAVYAAQHQNAAPRAAAKPQAPAKDGGGANVQMNDDSNPPLPQNETAVAYNVSDPKIAVAAANDYVSGGVVVMRTSDSGKHWDSTRIRGTGDFCTGGDPGVAYSRRDHVFYISQLCFFRALPFSGVQVYKSVDSGQTWTPGRQAARAASNCPLQLSYTDSIPTENPALSTWSHTAIQPDNPGGDGTGSSANQFSDPVVETDGTLDVGFVSENCNDSFDPHLLFQKSTDGGQRFLPSAVQIDKPGQYADFQDAANDDTLPPTNFRAPNTPSLA